MTKTCLQCGAVLPYSARACDFCETSPRVRPHTQSNRPVSRDHAKASPALNGDETSAWRDELALRLETYRGRKRKHGSNTAQSRLPFEEAGVVAAFPQESNPSKDVRSVRHVAPLQIDHPRLVAESPTRTSDFAG